MTQEEYERGWRLFASDKRFQNKERIAVLYEDGPSYGYDSHYVLHTGWAARVLAETKPVKHVDIAATVYFVSIASAFVPIDFYDYRAVPMPLSNVNSGSADLKALTFADNSISSLSCMHVLEHIGLGRYGDALDQEGDVKSAHELQRVLAPGGNLLVVVPVGQPKLVFNGHRIYGYSQVTDMFPNLKVHEFALIPNNTNEYKLIRYADPAEVAKQTYGCGCFWFTKP